MPKSLISTTNMDGIMLHVLYARQKWNKSMEFYGVNVVKMSQSLQFQGNERKKWFVNSQTDTKYI